MIHVAKKKKYLFGLMIYDPWTFIVSHFFYDAAELFYKIKNQLLMSVIAANVKLLFIFRVKILRAWKYGND